MLHRDMRNELRRSESLRRHGRLTPEIRDARQAIVELLAAAVPKKGHGQAELDAAIRAAIGTHAKALAEHRGGLGQDPLTAALRAASQADPRPQHRQAAEAGMTQSCYSAVLAGRNATLATLRRVAGVLGMDIRLGPR